jgi:hypothetical protein
VTLLYFIVWGSIALVGLLLLLFAFGAAKLAKASDEQDDEEFRELMRQRRGRL